MLLIRSFLDTNIIILNFHVYKYIWQLRYTRFTFSEKSNSNINCVPHIFYIIRYVTNNLYLGTSVLHELIIDTSLTKVTHCYLLSIAKLYLKVVDHVDKSHKLNTFLNYRYHYEKHQFLYT